MEGEIVNPGPEISVASDAIFTPIIDHFTLPDYRYTGWLEAGREGLALPGGKMLVSASSKTGTPHDAGCITKVAYALDTRRIFLQWRVQSPGAEAPVIVRPHPSTGDLLIAWNRCSIMERSPINAAISRDDGATWENMKLIEQHRGYAYSHPSMKIDADRVLLLYMVYPQYESLKAFEGCHNVRFASIPLEWFYRKSANGDEC